MMKDPNFQRQLQAMTQDPSFRVYMEAMQDMIKDPAKKKQIEAAAAQIKASL